MRGYGGWFSRSSLLFCWGVVVVENENVDKDGVVEWGGGLVSVEKH